MRPRPALVRSLAGPWNRSCCLEILPRSSAKDKRRLTSAPFGDCRPGAVTCEATGNDVCVDELGDAKDGEPGGAPLSTFRRRWDPRGWRSAACR